MHVTLPPGLVPDVKGKQNGCVLPWSALLFLFFNPELVHHNRHAVSAHPVRGRVKLRRIAHTPGTSMSS